MIKIADIASEVVREVAQELIDEEKALQAAMGLRDTGASAKSLRIEIVNSDTSVRGQVWGFERLFIQNNGRGPNKSGKPSREQVEALKGWAKRHGMDERAAWPIAINQAKKGTKVPNEHNPGGVLDKVFNSDNVKEKLKSKLRPALLKGFANLLFKD